MQIVIALGANIGDRAYYLASAKKLLETQLGSITATSSVYKTAAWGLTEQPDFYNQVLVLESAVAMIELMPIILAIETQLGRVRSEKWAERTIDIDVLFVGDSVFTSDDLTLPHPYIQQRKFVLVPLVEVLPHFIHPVLQQSCVQLLEKCTDTSAVDLIKH